MPGSQSGTSPERPRLIDTPVHRTSRRRLGLSPEFSGLPGDAPAHPTHQPPEMATSQVTFLQPRTPNIFHGEVYEDVEDWLTHFERVADYNQWNDRLKLRSIYFSLEDGARTWYENNERRMTTWNDFHREILETFSNTDRRDQALRLLESRIQKPNESVNMFAEDMARLFRRADPAMSEPKKLRYLMHGVKEQLFAGLVRNPPRTVQDFIKEATAIERAVQERSRQYDRIGNRNPSNVASMTSDESSLRDLIRSILREELQNLGISSQPSAHSLASMVREELHQAFASPYPSPQPCPTSYAAAVRQQAPRLPTPPTRPPPPPVHSWPTPEPGVQPPVRKTDLWRTPDRRPLCYHCGEPGHIYRRCPYREIGLPGFPPTAVCPRAGERPAAISDYLAERRATAPFRRSRSPSPGQYAPPNRRSSGDFSNRRSPTPPRGN